MKRFLILIALACFACAGYSQQAAYHEFGLDTLTNAGTLTEAWSKDLGRYDVVTYHVNTDLISGTAAGTIYYEYTLDGTEWLVASTDTVTTGAVTNQDHQITNFGGVEARIRVVGTGTQSTEFNNSISAKKFY